MFVMSCVLDLVFRKKKSNFNMQLPLHLQVPDLAIVAFCLQTDYRGSYS